MPHAVELSTPPPRGSDVRSSFFNPRVQWGFFVLALLVLGRCGIKMGKRSTNRKEMIRTILGQETRSVRMLETAMHTHATITLGGRMVASWTRRVLSLLLG